jgi:hypothetical protein
MITPSFMLRWAAGSLAVALAAGAQAGNDIDKKRREPVDVPPVVAGGLRYEAPRAGTPFGYAQDGGIVVARLADTGVLVWTRRVYPAASDPRMEGDKQDVFIKSLTLSSDGKRLVIVNERGQRFEMSLDGGGVSALP